MKGYRNAKKDTISKKGAMIKVLSQCLKVMCFLSFCGI